MLSYLRLEVLRTFRDRRFVFFSVFFPVMLFLLWSNVFNDGSTDEITHLNAAKYMMVAFGAYGAIGAAMSTTGPRLAIELQTGWLRQLQITPLPADTQILWETMGVRVEVRLGEVGRSAEGRPGETTVGARRRRIAGRSRPARRSIRWTSTPATSTWR